MEAMRTAVGVAGCMLPTAMLIGEPTVAGGSLHFRSSLSAYYHSSMRDVFVGFLSIIGFLLIMYLWGRFRAWDFVLSTLAGLAAFGVALFPTSRPGQGDVEASCDNITRPIAASCTALQERLGEHTVATIHAVFATAFITLLLFISALYAYRAWRLDSQPRMAMFHLLCTVVIALSAAWALFGVGSHQGSLGDLTPTYLGEVGAVYGFSVSWLANGVRPRTLSPAGRKASGAR
jgi:hypothetical protein